eukprot:scaffold148481_cov20-Prasinocladus_malaysianus.AAC.1
MPKLVSAKVVHCLSEGRDEDMKVSYNDMGISAGSLQGVPLVLSNNGSVLNERAAACSSKSWMTSGAMLMS